jgi:hypothetical protein
MEDGAWEDQLEGGAVYILFNVCTIWKSRTAYAQIIP